MINKYIRIKRDLLKKIKKSLQKLQEIFDIFENFEQIIKKFSEISLFAYSF